MPSPSTIRLWELASLLHTALTLELQTNARRYAPDIMVGVQHEQVEIQGGTISERFALISRAIDSDEELIDEPFRMTVGRKLTVIEF